MAERPFIYRFTRDFRLDDHAGLAAAASRGPVLPILVIDRTMEAQMRASERRAAFFCGSVRALASELAQRASRLIVRRGVAHEILPALCRTVDAAGVAWSACYDRAGIERDRRLQSVLEESGSEALVIHDAPAIAPDESAAERTISGAGYRAFAPYYEVWSKLPIVSHESPLLLRFANWEVDDEVLPAPGEFGAQERLEVGADAARHRLERFLREDATQYAIAARVPADDRTSHLSAHLSFGTISARSVVRAIRARLADPFILSEERVSLRLFLRALAHRDFFLQLSWFHPSSYDEPLQEKMRGFVWRRSHEALDMWRAGRTGYPLVDAGVRQLHATGWMHPHVRAVAASWLCFDLGVDWRVGRDEWNRWLIEDDPALATGNWQWIAGVGADMAQYPRIYNPQTQRRRYDPSGLYARRWIRELQQIPLEAWHGRNTELAQLELSLYPADEYPRPVLDHAVAARAFLKRYREYVTGSL